MSEPRKRQRITGGTSSLSDTQDMSAASVQDQHVATTLAASVEGRNVATTSDAQHILAANVEAQNVATNLAADVETQIVAAVPNVGPMNRSLWAIHKGKSHRSCTEDMSLPFLWGVAPCFMGCTTKASLNFQILERTIF